MPPGALKTVGENLTQDILKFIHLHRWDTQEPRIGIRNEILSADL